MSYALHFIHILVSIFLILVVLLQQGKGADLSVFGGGGTQVAFGARGAATVLHKLTVSCFILFLVTTVTLGILSAKSAPSVMSDVATEQPAEEDALTGPAGGTLATDSDANAEETPASEADSLDQGASDGEPSAEGSDTETPEADGSAQ